LHFSPEFSQKTLINYTFTHPTLSRNDATFLRLLKYVGVSSAGALFVGLSASAGIYQAKQRGDDFYLKQMDGPWFNANAKEFFRYACDIVSWGFKGVENGNESIYGFCELLG
jgi:hypothetical protein